MGRKWDETTAKAYLLKQVDGAAVVKNGFIGLKACSAYDYLTIHRQMFSVLTISK